MVINKSIFIQILCIILFFGSFIHQSYAQKPKLTSVSWLDNWELEIKTGTATLLTPVPDKYLERTNYVNIPLHTSGILAIFSVKKSISSHFEMGYQFDYIRIQGKVKVSETDINVLTQAYNHSYLIQYNLKKTNEFKPLFNYFLYYKIGAISLKNDPLDKLPDGTVTNPDSKGKFLNNVAVLTGVGAGIKYQLNSNFSLTSSLELNRSSDAVEEVYQIQKIFYNSSHSVNSYIALSFGLSYWFNFSAQKESSYYKPKSETEKRLTQSKITRKKGKSSASNQSTWFNSKKAHKKKR